MSIEISNVITIDGNPDDVALLGKKRRTDQLCNSKSGESYNSRATFGFKINERTARPRDRNDAFHETDPSTGVNPLDTVSVGLDATKYSFDRPLHSCDR
jgi:hypothetical protein